MHRRMRRLSRKIQRAFSDVKYVTTSYFDRSSSFAAPSYTSSNRAATRSPIESDDDDDDELVFQGTGTESEQARDGSLASIPCEFCHTQQVEDNLVSHQLRCLSNPANASRRRTTASNSTHLSARRRVVSDAVSSSSSSSPRQIVQRRAPTPTAPPRPRSPSPTERYTAPSHLVCPIQMTVFHDPVVASDGHTYERSAIINWLRTNHTSPVTRQEISRNTLNTNLIIKQLADDFRKECRRKYELYPYRLDTDLKKGDRIDYLSTPTKTFYQIEWCGENANLTDSDVVLVHLTGDQAEKIATLNCQLVPHPNIVRISGRVEHNEQGILLVQDNLPEQTLEDLFETNDEKLSFSIIDAILFQVSSALQHLESRGVVHGSLSAKNIFIYQIDPIPENVKIKLGNIGESNDADDLFAFAQLAQRLYSSPIIGNDNDCYAREEFIEKVFTDQTENRLTFTQITEMIIDLIHKRKFDFPCLSE